MNTETDFSKLKSLADDIILSETKETALCWSLNTQINKKKGAHLHTKYLSKIILTAAFCLTVIFSVMMLSPNQEVIIYASNGNSMVKLSPNEKVTLKKQNTPLGEGYVFELKNNEDYCCIVSAENLNLDNIFENGNIIYWIPDGINSDNFTDSSGNKIIIPKINISTLNMKLCNSEETIADVTLILERRTANTCRVELLIK